MIRTAVEQRLHRTIAVTVVAALSMMLSPIGPSQGSIAVAASATRVDVSPEHGTGPTGGTVVLTARVYDSEGTLVTGAADSAHVRFFFDPSSPNDIVSPGNSPDLDCDTDSTGSCTVSYIAAHPGTDIICAIIGGPTSQCDSEAVGDPEREDRVDAVEHINPGTPVVPGPTPTPAPSGGPGRPACLG